MSNIGTTKAAITALKQLDAGDITNLREMMDSLCADSVGPELAQWCRISFDAEDRRRHTLESYHYPALGSAEWSVQEAIGNLAFAAAVTRTATQLLTRPAQDFCWELHELLLGVWVEKLGARI